jgi:hypothetical protein
LVRMRSWVRIPLRALCRDNLYNYIRTRLLAKEKGTYG